MNSIIAVGEVLIDTVITAGENLQMTGNAGGAPANCLASAARFGADCGIIAKAGNDAMGRWLKSYLEAHGIRCEHLLLDDTRNTTMALVSLDAQGERSFSFYRSGCADVNLRESELPREAIRGAKIFHFGTVSMTEEPARSATLAAARIAKEAGVLVSFDPNLRGNLWRSLDDARRHIRLGLALADVVKISDDELRFVTGLDSLDAGAAALLDEFHPSLLCVTCGAAGCVCYASAFTARCGGFSVPVVDTTGAGDAFDGAVLYQLLKLDCRLDRLDMKTLSYLARFACAAGALATTKLGAIAAMPTLAQVEALLAAQSAEN